MKKLFTTSPHGAQALFELTNQNDPRETTGNKLFLLTENGRIGGHSITMTGEEIDSLTAQWTKQTVPQSQGKYLTRKTPGVTVTNETGLDEEYTYKGKRGRAGGGESWKLDVGAECNTLLRLASVSTAATAQTLRSIVARVANFEELEKEAS